MTIEGKFPEANRRTHTPLVVTVFELGKIHHMLTQPGNILDARARESLLERSSQIATTIVSGPVRDLDTTRQIISAFHPDVASSVRRELLFANIHCKEE